MTKASRPRKLKEPAAKAQAAGRVNKMWETFVKNTGISPTESAKTLFYITVADTMSEVHALLEAGPGQAQTSADSLNAMGDEINAQIIKYKDFIKASKNPKAS